jgi:hypothetical protein
MPSGAVIKKVVIMILLALLSGGCATTYVPVSWELGEQVERLSHSDPTLAILYEHYDPSRTTLRVAGQSFDEVMMPSEVKHHLGAYRKDTKLIYRNLYQQYTDSELRDLLVHEFSHHIWFSFMDAKQREEWRAHLERNPTPLQSMVRELYQKPDDYGTEDFAFTVEYARPVDLQELARLNLISAQECETLISEQKRSPQPANRNDSARLTGSTLSRNTP